MDVRKQIPTATLTPDTTSTPCTFCYQPLIGGPTEKVEDLASLERSKSAASVAARPFASSPTELNQPPESCRLL